MPFIQALGYDMSNPDEVTPEYTCDIGTKKGEKIDYAIMKDGKPILLIECKKWDTDLAQHYGQLIRYFHVSPAKFGILTNGITYWFYTDLETTNKMDEKPFMVIDMRDIQNNQIDELRKFHKIYFDIDNVLSSASELKYTTELKNRLIEEFGNPSDDLVKLLVKKVYEGKITSTLLEYFRGLVQKTITNHINDIISDRLKKAMENHEGEQSEEKKEVKKELPEGVVYMSDDETIVTTQEEIDGFNIVRAILYETVDIERITYRDAQSYFTILFDDNNRKSICRLHFNAKKSNQISVFDRSKSETKYPIDSLSDIYKYSKEIKDIVTFYMGEKK
jgi:hypothetical protein